MKQRVNSAVTMLAVSVFLLAAFGCSSSDDGAGSDTVSTTDPMAGMDHSNMNMGDPDATAASDVEGAELVSGTFEVLDTAPPGSDGVTGSADLARSDAGTTVTVMFNGLVPDTEYIAHVHESPCSDAGGDHYKFDENGSDVPPNEIHLGFTADSNGHGMMTAENEMIAGPDAVAVVIHPTEFLDNKLACADLS